MTTDTEDLIARLRVAYEEDTPLYITTESADALEAQAKRIAELEAALQDLLDWMPRVVTAEGQESEWESSCNRACAALEKKP